MAGEIRKRKARRIGDIRELTREDIVSLQTGEERRSLPATVRFRDSHHWVARLFAFGFSYQEISERTGYSLTRLYTLNVDPSFQELIAQKRGNVDEQFRQEIDDYTQMMTKARMMSAKQIVDQLEDADENGEKIPLRNLLAVSEFTADRTGYGKQSMQLNVNADFAALLDRAVKERDKVKQIEGTAKEVSVSPLRRV